MISLLRVDWFTCCIKGACPPKLRFNKFTLYPWENVGSFVCDSGGAVWDGLLMTYSMSLQELSKFDVILIFDDDDNFYCYEVQDR